MMSTLSNFKNDKVKAQKFPLVCYGKKLGACSMCHLVRLKKVSLTF